MATNGRHDWQSQKLADICAQIADGKHGDCQDQPHSGFYFLSCKDVANGKLNYEGARQIAEADFLDAHRRTKFAPNDVLITNSGTIGRMAIASDNEFTRRTTFQKSVAILKPIASRVEPNFLYYALQSDIRRLIEFAGGTAQKNLLLRDLRAFEVNVPPLPIQRRIAGILSAYDDLIENCQRRIKILETMARALYREWFVHFRFPGHENHPRVASPLGEIPEGWETRTLKDIASVTYGFPFASQAFNSRGEGTPVIRIRDIPGGATTTFTEEYAEAKYQVRDGHILVGMDGDFHMCIWSSGHAFQNQRVARFEPNGEIGNHHLFLALEEPIQTFNKAIVGTTVAHLGDMHIRTIRIVWPPATLRQKARDHLEPVSEHVIALKRKLRNLRRTRDLLLPRLLSGQIPLDDTESALADLLSGASDPPTPPPPSPATRRSHTGDPSKPSSPPDAAPPIDDTERQDVPCTIRQVFGDGAERDRDTAIRDIARALGYRRTGSRIHEVISGDLATAVRRGIVTNERGFYRLGFRSYEECDRDWLKAGFEAAIGRHWIVREDAIRAFARWGGFGRVGPVIEETVRSLMNGLIREGRLETDGPELIRRT